VASKNPPAPNELDHQGPRALDFAFGEIVEKFS
jgi:hypothetical protein